jgi:hypothetical protein
MLFIRLSVLTFPTFSFSSPLLLFPLTMSRFQRTSSSLSSSRLPVPGRQLSSSSASALRRIRAIQRSLGYEVPIPSSLMADIPRVNFSRDRVAVSSPNFHVIFWHLALALLVFAMVVLRHSHIPFHRHSCLHTLMHKYTHNSIHPLSRLVLTSADISSRRTGLRPATLSLPLATYRTNPRPGQPRIPTILRIFLPTIPSFGESS